MSDLTLLYYTANRAPAHFMERVQRHLLTHGNPIVSVSFKPMSFGDNICIGEQEPSIFQLYRQVLIAAEMSRTKYVACAEDDSLYHESHFHYRPSPGTFGYNNYRWMLDSKGIFYWRRRTVMSMCIAGRDLMVDTLRARFSKHPVRDKSEKYFSEPGKYESRLGLITPPMEPFETKIACLTFNHRPSLGGVRRLHPQDTIKEELEYWGSARELWKKFKEE